MNDTRRPRNPHIRACLGCQKRKTRCVPSQQDPSTCTFCARTKAQCVFDTPPPRTPLTRKNLDAAERRCGQLESLLRSLHPGIDIDVELKKLGVLRLNAQQASHTGGENGSDESQDEDVEWNEALSPNDPKRLHFKNDGMAMVPTAPSGYLGSSSMSRVVKKISDLLPASETEDAQETRPAPGSIRVRSSHTPTPTLNAALASITAVGRLVDAYFLFYNSSYPILHERTFRERWEKRAKINHASSWVPICYMVLAIGQWVLGDESDENPYYAQARAWFSAQALECGTLGAVQAFLLMGNYVQKRDKPNTGYNFMGIAYRMAVGLGMHREISPGSRDTLALERRRQVFWTLSCFDSGLSITTGRPATIIDAFVDVRLPRNIDDSDLDLASPIPAEVDYPTTYSAIIAHSHLASVANEIYTQFQSAQLHQLETNHDMAVIMEEKLLNWRASLPDYFTDERAPRWFLLPRAMLYWRARNIHILLWRGSQRHHAERWDRLAAGRKCSAAAMEAINEINEFCKTYSGLMNIMFSWYATYFIFQAMLVLEVYRLEKRSMPHISELDTFVENSACDEAVEKGKSCLNMLNTPKSAAGRCLETLDRIHKHMAVNNQPATPVGFGADPQQYMADSTATLDGVYDCFDGFNIDAAEMQWTMSADPSLHMLLDGPQMDNLFRGVEGFPGTLDQESFDYIAGDLYRIRDHNEPPMGG